jgi:predicted lipoprotein with Yx(FWY)xxD motif
VFSNKFLRTIPIVGLAASAAVILSGCGSNGSANATTTSSASGGTQTVSVRKVNSVGQVLVDAKGEALYSAAQESGGKVLCIGSCTSIWRPLTLPAGDTSPAAPADLDSSLGTVKRPDGAEQVTFDGAPLYSFAEDSGPGVVSGDGASDSFGGKEFTWHAATLTGASGVSTSTSPQGGYGY